MAVEKVEFSGGTIEVQVNDVRPNLQPFLSATDSGVRDLLGPELAQFYIPPGQEARPVWWRRKEARAVGIMGLATVIISTWYLTVVR